MYRLLSLAVCLIGLLVTTSSAAASKSPLQSKQLNRVIQLTDATFFDQVLNSTQAWMVMFYAPWCGHCRALEPEWAEAARTNGEWINYGAVDCTTQTTLAKQFKISAYPTMYVFPAGAKSPKLMSKYTGAPQHRAISTHALTLLSPRLISRPHDIRTLTSFLTKRSPSHTKVIVFATQRDALSIWQALSQHVSHVADVAYIPKGNDKLASLFSVRRYPTVIILRPLSLTSESPYPGITYHGDLSLTPIKSLILSYHTSSFEPSDIHPRDKDVMYHVEKKKHRKQHTSAQTAHGDDESDSILSDTEPEPVASQAETEPEPEPTLPPGVIHDIITPDDYNEHCLQATGVCVVMIVHDEESHVAGDDVVSRVASHYGVQNTKNSKSAQKQVSITRICVSLHGWDVLTSFASSYDMTLDHTAPLSVMALIPRRNRYRIHVGVPDATHITSFVDGVMDGSLKSTQKKDGLPSFQSVTSTSSSTSHGDDNELCGLEPTPAC